MLEIYNLVKKANEEGIKKAHAGLTGKQIDAICRKIIESNHLYANSFIHNTGHGLGIEIHELPYNAPSYEQKIPANAVVTIEPGIYVNNYGGVRIEDSIVIKNNGCLVLTKNCPK